MHTGEYKYKIGDDEFVLVYDWRALSRVQTTYGHDVFRNIFKLPADVADILLIGMKTHHPEMTKDRVLDLSPPLFTAIKAIDKALTFSYFGPDGPPKDIGEGDEEGKKTE